MLIKQLLKNTISSRAPFITTKQHSFSSQKPSQKPQSTPRNLGQQTLGNYKGIVYNMRKDAKVARSQRSHQTALHSYNKKVIDHLVQLTYYMKHNQWKSQFIYALLNYHKLGFKIVSDYAFLDSSSYMLELRNLKEEERWPTIRVIIGLKPRVIVTGAEEVEKFFIDNLYFTESYIKPTPELQFVKTHIDTHILPYLQSLMWHPTLTYQTNFHTDLYYHQSQQKNYMLVGILLRNFSIVTKAVFHNLLNIFKQKQRYLQSKQKLTQQLKNISELYLTKNQYFGGDKPNFIDFYLYANFKTKWDSKYLKNYLQTEISGEFKRWLLRMGWNCEYVKDRVTLL